MKAVIPAAGKGSRLYPVTKFIPKEMFPIGNKPAIHYVVEEAYNSGIEEIAVILRDGKTVIEDYLDSLKNDYNITYIHQKEQNGLGDAILLAEKFIGRESFSVLLGDDVLGKTSVLKNMIKIYEKDPIIALQEVEIDDIPKYGIMDGKIIKENLFSINNIVEKPSLENAPSNIASIGRYIFPPDIFDRIRKTEVKGKELGITDALNSYQNIIGFIDKSSNRYDVGTISGYISSLNKFGKDQKTMFTVGIIGNGFVGNAVYQGFKDTCIVKSYDVDPEKKKNTLNDTINSDIIFVCVPTPMNKDGSNDLSYVFNVIENIQSKIKDQVVIIKSTVIPGTMEKLQSKYPKIRFVFNPEFLTERNAVKDFQTSSRVVLGGKRKDTSLVATIYKYRFPTIEIFFTSFRIAETVKYFANSFLASKVSIANEFYDICNALNINYNETINIVKSDPRIGDTHFEVPGYDGYRGFGGHCFPKDINALMKKAEKLKIDPIILKTVWKKNLMVREKRDWEDGS